MKYLIISTIFLAIWYYLFDTKSTEQILDEKIEVSDFFLTPDKKLGFQIKNKYGDNIEINYLKDSLFNFLICNERKHSFKSHGWSLRTPWYPDVFKQTILKKNEKATFYINVKYNDADTALIVFSYKLKLKEKDVNKSCYLCVSFYNGLIKRFNPDFETKQTLSIMDPNKFRTNQPSEK